jgi:hypothetical protein
MAVIPSTHGGHSEAGLYLLTKTGRLSLRAAMKYAPATCQNLCAEVASAGCSAFTNNAAAVLRGRVCGSARPPPAIRTLVNAALDRLSPTFGRMYAEEGRPSIAPEHCCAPCCCRRRSPSAATAADVAGQLQHAVPLAGQSDRNAMGPLWASGKSYRLFALFAQRR